MRGISAGMRRVAQAGVRPGGPPASPAWRRAEAGRGTAPEPFAAAAPTPEIVAPRDAVLRHRRKSPIRRVPAAARLGTMRPMPRQASPRTLTRGRRPVSGDLTPSRASQRHSQQRRPRRHAADTHRLSSVACRCSRRNARRDRGHTPCPRGGSSSGRFCGAASADHCGCNLGARIRSGVSSPWPRRAVRRSPPRRSANDHCLLRRRRGSAISSAKWPDCSAKSRPSAATDCTPRASSKPPSSDPHQLPDSGRIYGAVGRRGIVMARLLSRPNHVAIFPPRRVGARGLFMANARRVEGYHPNRQRAIYE